MEREVVWTPEALRQLKKLSKNRHQIGKDIQEFVEDFSNRRLPGDRVQGIGGLTVNEHRMRDSSSSRGKSGGFRMYHYFDEMLILVVAIYLRSEVPRSVVKQIERILRSAKIID